MHRFAIVLVALGCSNSDDPKPATGGSEAPTKAQPATVAPPPANAFEKLCREGDTAACRDARMFIQGCLQGDGASCAEVAKAQPSEAPRWLARACRRGHGAPCDGKNDTLDVEPNETPHGRVAERIVSVYRHSIADCFAEGSAKPEATVTVVIKRESVAEAKSVDEVLRKCVEAQMTGWVFPDVAEVAEQVSVGFSVKERPEQIATRDAKTEAAIKEAIANKALMSVLTGAGDEGRYSISDLDQGADLDQAISDIKKGGGGGDSAAGDRRERPQGSAGTIGGHPKPDVKVRSRVKMGGLNGESTLDPDAVVKRIRSRYLRQIKACHERALQEKPKLGGKTSLRFEVGNTGRVTSASAKGFDPGVDTCIAARIRKWRFLAPKDADGNPTTAKFTLPIVLKPAS